MKHVLTKCLFPILLCILLLSQPVSVLALIINDPGGDTPPEDPVATMRYVDAVDFDEGGDPCGFEFSDIKTEASVAAATRSPRTQTI